MPYTNDGKLNIDISFDGKTYSRVDLSTELCDLDYMRHVEKEKHFELMMEAMMITIEARLRLEFEQRQEEIDSQPLSYIEQWKKDGKEKQLNKEH